ncbi:stealth conserved region 3 domain-containing protein [uncultured Demequina sp.]|uniref:stealth conserved region 3 domain-containing protein n=1 Tax=uncultured Demequina sp. TaxID=693499 RepID=UPI0025F23A68|nr:stealth conserved region 3 domain-containing protein [uncultured Demequina sp.]
MKVSYLLTTPDFGAGTERTILTQASILAGDHDVEVIGVYRSAKVPHHRIDSRVKVRYLVDERNGRPQGTSRLVPSEWDNQFSPVTDAALERCLRGLRADIIVTSTPALAALATEFAPRRTAVIHQEHRPPMHRQDGLGPLVSHGARIDLLTNLTQRSQDWLLERLGESAPPMAVVENPHEPGFVPRTSLANRLIVGAGRFTFQKRFVDLIRAFEIADRDVHGWRLRIFGDGYEYDQLRSEVHRLGLLGKVDIVPPTRRLAAEMSKASIYGLSSRYEGLPMVGIEAAVAGVPMVAYDIETGPREIISKAGGGVLAPNDSVEALGSSLALLMEDPAELARASERALEGSRAFAPHVIRSRWLEIFEQVAGKTAGDGFAATVVPSSVEAPPTPATLRLAAEATHAPARSLGAQRELERGVLTVLDDLGVDYARVRAVEPREDIVVLEADRAQVLDALVALVHERQWSAQAYRGGGALGLAPWTKPADAPATLPRASHVAIDVTSADPEHPAARVAVEFWAPGADGTHRAPRPNANAEWVDDATWRQWTAHQRPSISGQPLWNVADFPIDVVFTWVDGADPAWSARRAEHLDRPAVPDDSPADDAKRDARFTSRDEIYFAVAAVHKYAPWTRTIYIVTDGQTPARVVEDFPDVVIVDHSEIFPDPSVLPVFNSHAIESCLHRIPGLSEHFLYFNDDVMLTRSAVPEDFFLGNGVAKFFASNFQVNHGGHRELPHLGAGANNRALVLRDFGLELTQSMLHTPYPHVKSVVEEMEERYSDEFDATRARRFRSGDDISVMSSFAQYYGYASRRYVPGQLRYDYVSLRGAGLVDRMKRALENDALQAIALGEPRDRDWRHPDEHALVEEFLTRIAR